MADVTICIDEGEVPLVTALLHVKRTMRTKFAKAHIEFRDGIPLDIVVEERLRIHDYLLRIESET